jgi:hypothetical protein
MMMAGRSGAVRQHPVDDRKVIFEIAQRLPRIRNRADRVDDTVQLRQQAAEIGSDLRFVFDYEGAHADRPCFGVLPALGRDAPLMARL